jgi:Ca-activated chloride channel family protein
MTFAWPWMLLSLLAVPLLVAGYRRLVARQDARRDQLASMGLVVHARDHRTASRGRRTRHLGPALLLAALTLLLVALARPEATIADPRREGTVILAFDVSTSMSATDLRPTRMEAAKTAARGFVTRQPTSIRIGVVAFGESGVIALQPSTDQAQVLAAIDRLAPQGGTAVGRGILTSLTAIAGRPVVASESPTAADLEGVDIGYYGSAAVVLLSDGENTADPDPLPLAELASVAGVRIHPIGLGSPEGTVLEVDGFSVATALDEGLLREIASTTDGTYYRAADAAALADVYDSIELDWTVQTRRIEVTAVLAGAAALLLLAGAVVSLVRTGRVV